VKRDSINKTNINEGDYLGVKNFKMFNMNLLRKWKLRLEKRIPSYEKNILKNLG